VWQFHKPVIPGEPNDCGRDPGFDKLTTLSEIEGESKSRAENRIILDPGSHPASRDLAGMTKGDRAFDSGGDRFKAVKKMLGDLSKRIGYSVSTESGELYEDMPECPVLWTGMNGILCHSPPSMGGDKGEGGTSGLFTPTSILPHQGGGGCLGKFLMPRVSTRGALLILLLISKGWSD
jgi:hypothetical protein